MYRWSAPTPINKDKPSEGVARAYNQAQRDVDICVGTYSASKEFQAVIYHKDVRFVDHTHWAKNELKRIFC